MGINIGQPNPTNIIEHIITPKHSNISIDSLSCSVIVTKYPTIDKMASIIATVIYMYNIVVILFIFKNISN